MISGERRRRRIRSLHNNSGGLSGQSYALPKTKPPSAVNEICSNPLLRFENKFNSN